MRNLKRTLSAGLTLCMLAGLSMNASAATTFEPTYPTEPTAIDESVLTTLTQRAGTEIPLVFGVNVLGGNMFDGLKEMGGTVANANPDPYIWNFNYQWPGYERMSEPGPVAEGREALPEGTFYQALGNTLDNPNGLYNSGGANQVYTPIVDELGGVGYAVGNRVDIFFGFNSNIIDQVDLVHSWKAGDEYYQEGDENYQPGIVDVQTGSLSSRIYAWSEMGKALSAYLEANPGKTTRYDDPYIIGVNMEQFSAGIPYYISSLIANGSIAEKTAAYVYAIDGFTLSCVDPSNPPAGDASGNNRIYYDVYAEANNFNFLEGNFTLQDLKDKGVDLIILGNGVSSYGVISASTPSEGGNAGGGQGGNAGGGQGGNAGGQGGNAAVSTVKQDLLAGLVELGYTADNIPMVMGTEIYKVTPGNGYNYSPISALFPAWIQAYAYMDELAQVNPAINPLAMWQYGVENFLHVEESSARNMALYYVGSNWDSVDETYDQVPDVTNNVYDKTAIQAAIQDGIRYALSGEAEKNGNLMVGAVRAASNNGDNAYVILTQLLSDTKPATSNYITLTVNGKTQYLDIDAMLATEGNLEESGGNEHEYYNTRTSYEAILDYYNGGEYGYGDDLQTTLQNYADRMNAHVWKPDTTVPGTYGYGLTGDTSSTSKTDITKVFTDLEADAWYLESVAYVYENDVMSGDSGKFTPNENLSRAMLCQILYNLEGQPSVSNGMSFTDVADSFWGVKAIQWCAANHIVGGPGDGTFGLGNVTRQDAATILYRYYTEYKGGTAAFGDLSGYNDADSVAGYANEAMRWAVGSGIISGKDGSLLDPMGTATRAEVAAMIMRFAQSI